MTQFLAMVRKDILLARRDWHGLLLLFAMPMAFVIIMSLALQDKLGEDAQGAGIEVLVLDRSGVAAGAALVAALGEQQGFRLITAPAELPADPQAAVARDEFAFLLSLSAASATGDARAAELDAALLVGPGTSAQVEALFTAAVRQALAAGRALALLQDLRDAGLPGVPDQLAQPALTVTWSAGSASAARPSSVQQNVPAWLVFGMFFTVIPLSNTLISERQQGTLRRLRTIAMPGALPLLAKLVPYSVINLVQAGLMLAAGVYVVPALGGEALSLGESPAGLAAVALSVSAAALGYGMLIAVVARTTDQAVTLGGAGNIILAAIGGIMVPRFVMPEAMRALSQISPMSWGLDGFLDVVLRHGGVMQVLPECAALVAFGLGALVMALALEARRAR